LQCVLASLPSSLVVDASRDEMRRRILADGAMMSYLYRPTPIVNLGNGAFASKNAGRGLPGSTMQGIPAGSSRLGAGAPTGAVSNMRRVDTRRQPWLAASGTMGRFVPNGLGDDATSAIDWSTASDITPISPPDFTPSYVPPPDLGFPDFLPNAPALIPSYFPAPPSLSEPSVIPSSGILTPPAGAGPTGTGIPGTQPLNPALLIGQGVGLVSQIKSWFAPAAPATPNYTTLPAIGGPPAAAPSWLSQKTLPLSQQLGSNGLVLAAAAVVVLVLGSGGYAAGRSKR